MRLERFAAHRERADMTEGLREFNEGVQKLLGVEKVAEAFVAALPPKPEEDAPRAVRDEGPMVYAEDPDDEESTKSFGQG
jgi:hypothetical protein